MFNGLKNLPLSGLSDLSLDVSVKIPKPVTEALKLLPSAAKILPQYAREAEKQTARAESAIDSINLTVQTLGVALVFGGIIAILLLREKEKK